MPISFSCPACRSPFRVADENAGRSFVCPGCRQNVVVPAASVAPAPAPKPAPKPAPMPPPEPAPNPAPMPAPDPPPKPAPNRAEKFVREKKARSKYSVLKPRNAAIVLGAVLLVGAEVVYRDWRARTNREAEAREAEQQRIAAQSAAAAAKAEAERAEKERLAKLVEALRAKDAEPPAEPSRFTSALYHDEVNGFSVEPPRLPPVKTTETGMVLLVAGPARGAQEPSLDVQVFDAAPSLARGELVGSRHQEELIDKEHDVHGLTLVVLGERHQLRVACKCTTRDWSLYEPAFRASLDSFKLTQGEAPSTPAPTTSGLTSAPYRDEVNGFSIVPPRFGAFEAKDTGVPFGVLGARKGMFQSCLSVQLGVKGQVPRAALVDKLKRDFAGKGVQLASEDRSVSGRDAALVDYVSHDVLSDGPHDVHWLQLIVFSETRAYYVACKCLATEFATYEKSFRASLDSFKLDGEPPPRLTSPLYHDEANGYSVEPPRLPRLKKGEQGMLFFAHGPARDGVPAMCSVFGFAPQTRAGFDIASVASGATILEKRDLSVSGRDALLFASDERQRLPNGAPGNGVHRKLRLVVFGEEHTFLVGCACDQRDWSSHEAGFRASVDSFRLGSDEAPSSRVTNPAYRDDVNRFSIAPPRFAPASAADQRLASCVLGPPTGAFQSLLTVMITTKADKPRAAYLGALAKELAASGVKLGSQDRTVFGRDAALLEFVNKMVMSDGPHDVHWLQLVIFGEEHMWLVQYRCLATDFVRYENTFRASLDSFTLDDRHK